ncbi:MAG: hypothetical protein KF804_08360 [Burkholderiales bacterium]|nr:hypothetical protein [Burkholderiales bacterium]
MQAKLAALCCAIAAAWLSPAAAQQTERKHPADPSAAVPAPVHSSAFSGYQPLGSEKPGPWRELNDEVARIGGHIGILRGTAPGATSGKAGGHAGHHPGGKK